jgi:4-amino-4-deoxy-L-arabinose transferase-like glycosyltransferase
VSRLLDRGPAAALLVLAALAATTLAYRLGTLPLLGADEPRYARVAEEMQATGRWVTPILEGRPWLEKPPLYYWITIPLVGAFGRGEATARAGPALAAAVTAAIVFWLGWRWFGPAAGFYAAGILLTSIGFVAFGRSASTDMPLAACLTGALALLGAAVVEPRLGRTPTLAAYLALGLAVLAKGPVALVLAAGVALAFWWLDARGGALACWRVPAGLGITLAVALPWFAGAFRENGFAFVSVFLLNHNLARYVTDLHHHSEPFWYYVPVVAGLLFPWTGWLPLLVPRRNAQPEAAKAPFGALLWLACWAAFPLLFFSIARSKLPGYVLPCLPPLALVLGWRFAELDRRGARPRAAGAFLAFATLGAAAAAIALRVRYDMSWGVVLVLAAALPIPAAAAFVAARRGRLAGAWAGTALAGALLVVALLHAAAPALARSHSAQILARAALAARAPGEPIVSYRWFHHTLHYYTGYQVEADLARAEDLARFALAHPRFLIVTRLDRLDEVRRATGFSLRNMAASRDLVLVRAEHP